MVGVKVRVVLFPVERNVFIRNGKSVKTKPFLFCFSSNFRGFSNPFSESYIFPKGDFNQIFNGEKMFIILSLAGKAA